MVQGVGRSLQVNPYGGNIIDADLRRSDGSFRDSFGEDYGLTITDGPMTGLLGRAVVVIGADGTVAYTELVPEIASEPDYDAALAAAR